MPFTFSGLNFVGDVSAQAVFAPTPEYYLWSWGRNSYGNLGLGDTTNKSSPVQIGALTTWSNISAGNANSAAIKTNGTLWVWGIGNFGGLGQGNTISRSSPVQIGALTTWSNISAANNHILAIFN
jgi:alpha-tubulin suppressor-like RCC1 family protein